MPKNLIVGISVLIILLLPDTAGASVVINEISWMGTDEGGASCEWIELANTDSSDESLVGYSITIENKGSSATPKVIDLADPSARYTGIAGNGYYLVARNSGACVGVAPEKTADWSGSFGTGISNDGAKLILKKAGSAVDTLDALAGWSASGIGGKNTSGKPKETPQRSGSIWVTAKPTPRMPNAAPTAPDIEEDPTEEENATTTPTIGGSSIDIAPSPYMLPKMYIVAGPNRLVATDADVIYRASAYNELGKYRPGATIAWSFGDGDHRTGKNVSHTYYEPGEYLVVVRATYGSATAIRTIMVYAETPKISITSVSEEGIRIHNERDQIADISGWRLVSGRQEFRIPTDTAILPHGSVLFSTERTRLSGSNEISIRFPSGKIEASYAPLGNSATTSEPALPPPEREALSTRQFVASYSSLPSAFVVVPLHPTSEAFKILDRSVH